MTDSKTESSTSIFGTEQRGDLTPRFARRVELGVRNLLQNKPGVFLDKDNLDKLPWKKRMGNVGFEKHQEGKETNFKISAFDADGKSINLDFRLGEKGNIVRVGFGSKEKYISLKVDDFGLAHLNQDETTFRARNNSDLERAAKEFSVFDVEVRKTLIQRKKSNLGTPAALMGVLIMGQTIYGCVGGNQQSYDWNERYQATVTAAHEKTPTPIPPENEFYKAYEKLEEANLKFILLYKGPDGETYWDHIVLASGMVIDNGQDSRHLVFLTNSHSFDHKKTMMAMSLPEGSEFSAIMVGNNVLEVSNLSGDLFIASQLKVAGDSESDVAAVRIDLDDRFPNGLGFGEIEVDWNADLERFKGRLAVSLDDESTQSIGIGTIRQDFSVVKKNPDFHDQFYADFAANEGHSGEGVANKDAKLVALVAGEAKVVEIEEGQTVVEDKTVGVYESIVSLVGKEDLVRRVLED